MSEPVTQYYLNWSCDSLSLSYHNFISNYLVALLTMVLIVKPTAVELSVWIGDLGCGKPISMSVLCSGIIFLTVIYRAANFASDAEAISDLMIFAIVNTGPLIFGFALFSERKL